MKITRKQFLGLTGASMLVAVTGKQVLAELEGATKGAKPGPRKQYAMIVDTRKCSTLPDCTKCTEACDSTHNIPVVPDVGHEIKWIWKEDLTNVFESQQMPYLETTLKGQKTVVLCNHCDDPPCVRVCPTGATWKREEDGIVMMDWHRCIGCRYCMAACPYGSRSFDWVDPRTYLKVLNPEFPTRTKGVVEKCTFCSERLAQGQGPACVEACPAKALVFGDLNDPGSEVRKVLGSGLTLRRKPSLGTGPNIYYIL
ncbi:MAG: sulfate reduction electron transfer complex DsrMKJOP subunit DsrO [Acidobacteriaceae bacterium]